MQTHRIPLVCVVANHGLDLRHNASHPALLERCFLNGNLPVCVRALGEHNFPERAAARCFFEYVSVVSQLQHLFKPSRLARGKQTLNQRGAVSLLLKRGFTGELQRALWLAADDVDGGDKPDCNFDHGEFGVGCRDGFRKLLEKSLLRTFCFCCCCLMRLHERLCRNLRWLVKCLKKIFNWILFVYDVQKWMKMVSNG